jgi:hypothetical protein
MNIPPEQAIILTHVLENILLEDPGSSLSLALQQHGCQSILDVMGLTPWEIETLQWTDGYHPKETLGRGPRVQVVALQAFVLSLHSSPSSIPTKDWLALTEEQFTEFRMSPKHLLVRWQAPRPTPPLDAFKTGEQYKPIDVFESFDIDEFQATMLSSHEPSLYMYKENTTTNDGPFIEALENAIMFFETFCLEDDFEAHAIDETNNPIATMECVPVTIVLPLANKDSNYSPPAITVPAPDNKDSNYSHYAPIMKDTMVYIEYPDRTKFVSSMNNEQYEELKTYYDVGCGCQCLCKAYCPMVI